MAELQIEIDLSARPDGVKRRSCPNANGIKARLVETLIGSLEDYVYPRPPWLSLKPCFIQLYYLSFSSFKQENHK